MFGTPTMIRTWDPQIRNLVLYPTELPGLNDERDSSRIALANAQRDDSGFGKIVSNPLFFAVQAL